MNRTIACPICGADITLMIHPHIEPLSDVTERRVFVTLSADEVNHICPPSGGGGLEVAS